MHTFITVLYYMNLYVSIDTSYGDTLYFIWCSVYVWMYVRWRICDHCIGVVGLFFIFRFTIAKILAFSFIHVTVWVVVRFSHWLVLQFSHFHWIQEYQLLVYCFGAHFIWKIKVERCFVISISKFLTEFIRKKVEQVCVSH